MLLDVHGFVNAKYLMFLSAFISDRHYMTTACNFVTRVLLVGNVGNRKLHLQDPDALKSDRFDFTLIEYKLVIGVMTSTNQLSVLSK